MSNNILPPGASWDDPDETRISSWIKSWDPNEKFDVALLSVPLSNMNTQPNQGWAAADAIRRVFPEFTTYSSDYDVDIGRLNVTDRGKVNLTASNTEENIKRILNETLFLLQQYPQTIPMIIGGDHSVTAITAKAFCKARKGQRVGLIYFDAHHDVRMIAEDIPLAGSQVRILLEDCENLEGSNVAQIGVHGFLNSAEHKHWAEQQGVHIYSSRAVRVRGIAAVMDEVIGIKLGDVDAIYVSVDIDVLSQIYAIGASGRNSPDGMEASDLIDAVYALGLNPKVGMFDIVEYDPFLDLRDLTARTCCSIILAFMAGLIGR